MKKVTILMSLMSMSFGLVSNVQADFADPWLPDWSGETGYTSQFWGLHAVGGSEPSQPLAPDNYKINPGSASASWSNSPGDMVSWAESAIGQQPAWVEGVYGGMVDMAGGFFDIGIMIETGSDAGYLQIFVQYDWYN